MKQVILTGDRPTGRLHVGHYVGSLKRRVDLQNSGKYDEIYIMVADAQALTDNAEHPEKVRQNIMQVALDYLACGIDPEKSTIFIQSMVPELTELTFYYMNLVTVARVQRNPTVKAEIKMRNFEASIPVGFFCYPISQAADITAFKATEVPVGEDQMPMIEQCKEIVHKFNSVYGETLVDPKIVLPDNEACLRLPGTDGKAKMSKSLGNGIDPLEVIDKYGADALRYTLITGNAPGNDMRFYNERVEASRNFANKVWNASRFIMMNLGDKELKKPADFTVRPADRWIMSKCNNLVKDVTENMDKFELGIALSKIYDFLWDEFCDWYIEMAKYPIYHADEDPEAANAALWTLREVLKKSLKLLHPYMPFVTEEIYSKLVPEEESLMMSDWPVYEKDWNFPIAENIVDHYKEIIRGIRNVRAEMNVPNSRKATAYVVCEDEQLGSGLAMLSNAAQNMAALNKLVLQKTTEGIAEDAVSIVVPDATVYLPLEELIDFEQEIERLTKEEERLTKEIARSNGMLNNEKFVSKAPAAKVQEEREKLETYQQMMAQVKERLEGLKAKQS